MPTDEDELDTEPNETGSKLRERLEAALAEAAEAKRDVAELREDNAKKDKTLALSQAKLDGLNEQQVKALMAVHEGEMTSEALLATASALGYEPKSESLPDLAAVTRIQAAAVGAPGTGSGSSNDAELAMRIRATKNEHELSQLLDSVNPGWRSAEDVQYLAGTRLP